MKLKFDIATYRTRDGGWNAQVLLAGQVLYEDMGPASEQQAVANVTQSFACLLGRVIEREEELLSEEAAAEANA